MRIAILILSMKNDTQLQALVNKLRVSFDLYLFLDKKENTQFLKYDHVKVYNRFHLYDAHYSLVKATLFLLERAAKKEYDRYILIGGEDVPLKSNGEISDFFWQNTDKEFISFGKLSHNNINQRSYAGIDRFYFFGFPLYYKSQYLQRKIIRIETYLHHRLRRPIN